MNSRTLRCRRSRASGTHKSRILMGLVHFSRRRPGDAEGDRGVLARLAETPLVALLTDAILGSIPESDDLSSFDELAARRDASGVVRLKR